MGLIERIRATPAEEKPEIIVLDDAQLCGVNPSDGLTTARLAALAGKTHLIVIIHDKDLAEWTRQTTDRTTDPDIPLATIGATPDLVALLTQNKFIYKPTLDTSELTVAAEVYDKAHASLDQLDLTRMAEVFASVTQLTEKATAALTTGGLHAAIVNAAIDATIAFPAGITLDWLDRLTHAHFRLEEPNKPWKSSYLDTAVDWATTGIAPRSPHAILTRIAANTPDADIYRLLDVLTPTLRSAERSLTHLLHIALPVTAISDIAYWYYKNQNRIASRQWWMVAAKQDHQGALFSLGALAGEDGDRGEARSWFLKAAALNHLGALFGLGMLAEQDGDRGEARIWYLKAAALNQPDALFNLGALAREDGDRGEARTWFLKAAALNHPNALFGLGILAEQDGDRGEARTWYLKAAALNHPNALFNLGILAEQDGDRGEARTWYLKAAALNHPGALFGLGVLAEHDGDRNAARIWWEQAVDAGSNEAQESLDRLHDENDGQPKA